MGHGGLMAGMAQVLSGSAASLLPCKRLREAHKFGPKAQTDTLNDGYGSLEPFILGREKLQK